MVITLPVSCEPPLEVGSSAICSALCPLSIPRIHINEKHLAPIALLKGYPHGRPLNSQQPG